LIKLKPPPSSVNRFGGNTQQVGLRLLKEFDMKYVVGCQPVRAVTPGQFTHNAEQGDDRRAQCV
jgi:hypothetical protein